MNIVYGVLKFCVKMLMLVLRVIWDLCIKLGLFIPVLYLAGAGILSLTNPELEIFGANKTWFVVGLVASLVLTCLYLIARGRKKKD